MAAMAQFLREYEPLADVYQDVASSNGLPLLEDNDRDASETLLEAVPDLQSDSSPTRPRDAAGSRTHRQPNADCGTSRSSKRSGRRSRSRRWSWLWSSRSCGELT
ncbi:hypothetical protein GQ600_2022 [Phytophthora cactorum]|nr:hypothetical protein GQ600_2022 [Phytophthora cactorum]